MTELSVVSPETLYTNRKAAILELLCLNGKKLSHSALSNALGLPLPTMHRLCTQLKNDGLIIESGTNRDGRGRPVQLLSFNTTAHATLALELRQSEIIGIVTGLDIHILHKKHFVAPSRNDGQDYIEKTIDAIRSLSQWASDSGIPHTGIGISVPGIVRPNGTVSSVSELNWNQEVPLAEILQSNFDDIILVENNANAAAVGEHTAGAGYGKNPVITMIMRNYGIGTGTISNGKLLRGSHGTAGEVGFTPTGFGSFSKYFPTHGDLEQHIHDIIKSDSPNRKRQLDELYDLIALTVSNLCIIVDPEIIIFDVDEVLNGHELIDEVRRRLIGVIPSVPAMTITELGHEAPLIGIAALIARKVRGVIFNE